MLNSIDSSQSPYIVSDVQYDIPYTKTVKFEQDIEKEDYSSDNDYTLALIVDLRKQAEAYLKSNCVPKLNYTLKANIDKISDVGDTVEVTDERLGIDLLTSIISYKYDCISGRYTEIEFGNFRRKLSNIYSDLSSYAVKTASAASASSLQGASESAANASEAQKAAQNAAEAALALKDKETDIELNSAFRLAHADTELYKSISYAEAISSYADGKAFSDFPPGEIIMFFTVTPESEKIMTVKLSKSDTELNITVPKALVGAKTTGCVRICNADKGVLCFTEANNLSKTEYISLGTSYSTSVKGFTSVKFTYTDTSLSFSALFGKGVM